MVKYRRLHISELQEMQKEFVEFLILNGIAAEDWEKIRVNEVEKSLEIIDLFSDVVFEKIMRQTKFVEKRQKNKLEVFHCLEDRFVIVGLDAGNNEEVNFESHDFFTKAKVDPPAGLEAYTAEKPYKNKRELEIFMLIESGGMITDEKMYKTLCMAMVK